MSKILSGKKTGQLGIIKSRIFDIGDRRLHLHHWMFGLGALILALIFKFSLPFSPLSVGILGGWVFQGIYDYSDWHKILFKKNKIIQQKI